MSYGQGSGERGKFNKCLKHRPHPLHWVDRAGGGGPKE